MNIRPYITFDGECKDALDLYEVAFMRKAEQIAKFSDMPPNPNFNIPESFKDKILQATIKFGENYIRLSDCGPEIKLNSTATERIAIAIEAEEDVIRNAFEVLSRDGESKLPLSETFFSPLFGIVADKYGVQWNLICASK